MANRRAVTLVEVLVVVSVMSLMAVLLFAAVQRSREAARRVECVSHMRQVAVAVQSYHAAHGVIPPSHSYGFSYLSAILPQVEQQPLAEKVNRSAFWWDIANRAVAETPIPLYHCPSDPATHQRPVSSYAGNLGAGAQTFGYDGAFCPASEWNASSQKYDVRYLRYSDIIDGLSSTAAIGEMLVADGRLDPRRVVWQTPVLLAAPTELASFATACAAMAPPSFADTGVRGILWLSGDEWTTGYNHILRPNGKSCTNAGLVRDGAYSVASAHVAGVNIAFADGHVAFVTDGIDWGVWRALGTRDGSDVVDLVY